MKKDILYLAHRVPFPPNRGDRIRSYHVLRFLSQHARVHLACLRDEPMDPDASSVLDGMCHQVAIVPIGSSRWARGAMSVAMGRTATEGLFHSPRLMKTVRRWSQNTKFHAVVVFCSSMMQYASIPELAEVPTIIDLVDLDSQKWFDYARASRGVKRALYQLEGRRLRRLETNPAKNVEAITFVSQAEAALYRELIDPATRTPSVQAITNGVDLEFFNPMELTEAEGHGSLQTVEG